MELIFNMAVTLLLLKGKRNYRRVVVNFEIHLYSFYFLLYFLCSVFIRFNIKHSTHI